MRKSHLLCVFASAALAGTSFAEDPVIARVVTWTPKPGMEAKLEEGIKRHNDFHRKQNDAMSHQTYVVQSGPRTGQYVRVAAGRNWKDFDAEATWSKADQADSALNTNPYTASAIPSYYRMRTELSRPAPGDTPAAMYALTFFRLGYAHIDDFDHAARKIKEAAEKAQWPRNWVFFSLVNGGDGPQIVLSQPRASYADFNPPSGKSFGEMLEEQLGRDDARAAQDEIGRSVLGVTTELLAYRADLSYLPARR